MICDPHAPALKWALAHACMTRFDAALWGSFEEWQAMLRAAQVRVQWDPERTLVLEPLPWRTIQVGLGAKPARLS